MSTAMEYLEAAFQRDTDDCIDWPYGTQSSGYGSVWDADMKSSQLAHRVMCEMEYGPPPSPKHVAAHHCGRRTCINWKHIRWATSKENSADMVKHDTTTRGSANVTAKLDEGQVWEIKCLLTEGEMTKKAIAEKFKVSQRQVYSISTGQDWAWLVDKPKNIPYKT